MVRPTAEPAGEQAVGRVLSTLCRFLASELLLPEEDLAQFGLDKPLFEIQVGTTEGTLHILRFSSLQEDNRVYVQVEGKPWVYQTVKSRLDVFDIKAADMRVAEEG